jgi:hypothetical protein
MELFGESRNLFSFNDPVTVFRPLSRRSPPKKTPTTLRRDRGFVLDGLWKKADPVTPQCSLKNEQSILVAHRYSGSF